MRNSTYRSYAQSCEQARIGAKSRETSSSAKERISAQVAFPGVGCAGTAIRELLLRDGTGEIGMYRY
jgi:hypothetical protein